MRVNRRFCYKKKVPLCWFVLLQFLECFSFIYLTSFIKHLFSPCACMLLKTLAGLMMSLEIQWIHTIISRKEMYLKIAISHLNDGKSIVIFWNKKKFNEKSRQMCKRKKFKSAQFINLIKSLMRENAREYTIFS